MPHSENTVSTFQHLAAELLGGSGAAASVVALPPESGALSSGPRARRHFNAIAPESVAADVSGVPLSRPLVVDVQLEWPPVIASEGQRDALAGMPGSPSVEGDTIPLPRQGTGATTTPRSVFELEAELREITHLHAEVSEPSTQELLAGEVRITPQSQVQRRRSEEAAAVRIQAAARGAQRRAQMSHVAAAETHNFRSMVDSYERCVLPELLVRKAVGQAMLRCELAEVRAERDALGKKALEAQQAAAFAEADCAALRLRVADAEAELASHGDATSRRVSHRRMGGA